MRYLERSILLQVIDNRWREHLYDMDYLREGIHLRGFAQIDPLVAYKNEGFDMFEELMHSIWEEFSKLDLPRRGRDRPGPGPEGVRANGGGEPTALDYSGGTLDGAALGAAARSRRRRARWRPKVGGGPAGGNGAQPEVVETVVKERAREHRSQRPLLVRVGQEYKKCRRG